MQSIVLKPSRGKTLFSFWGTIFLAGLALPIPLLSLPCALLVPLLACCLKGKLQQGFALMAALLPGVSVLLHTGNWGLAASMASVGLLPLAAAYLSARSKKKRTLYQDSTLYMAAAFCGILFLLLAAADKGSIAQRLADVLGKELEQSQTLTLLRLVTLGLAGLPSTVENMSLAQILGSASLRQEILLSFRTRVTQMLEYYLPIVLVQGIVILGLFMAIRMKRAYSTVLILNRQKSQSPTAVMAVPPGFRFLVYSRSQVRMLAAVLLSAGLASLISGAFWETLSNLLFLAFRTAFQLLGAAVLLYRLAPKTDDRVIPFGILVGLIFLFLPLALLIVGILEPFCRFRLHRHVFHIGKKEGDSL